MIEIIFGVLFIWALVGVFTVMFTSDFFDYYKPKHLGFGILWPFLAVYFLVDGVLWLVRNAGGGIKAALDEVIKK